jgi:hypothetical protein
MAAIEAHEITDTGPRKDGAERPEWDFSRLQSRSSAVGQFLITPAERK